MKKTYKQKRTPVVVKKPTRVFRKQRTIPQVRSVSAPKLLRLKKTKVFSRLAFFKKKMTNSKYIRNCRFKRIFQQTTSRYYFKKVSNTLNVKRLKNYVRSYAKKHTSSGVDLLRQTFFASTFWRLRMIAFSRFRTKSNISFRVANYKYFTNTPHTSLPRSPLHYRVAPRPIVGLRINRKQLWVLFRMRFERFMFKALGCRVYVWFSNLWRTVGSDISGWFIYENFVVARLVKKGMRFTIREAQARVLVKSAWLAVTMLGGVSVFMQMLSRMVQTFRSHWAVVMYTLRVLDSCRCYFWYKALMQYRMVVRGKFGGHMRASQKIFQHGVVKLNAWALDIDYYRIRPVTKYGTFSLRFWVQFCDLRSVRIRKVMASSKGIEADRISITNQ